MFIINSSYTIKDPFDNESHTVLISYVVIIILIIVALILILRYANLSVS